MTGHGAHLVQFYGDDEELSASVGSFLGEGLAEGCPAVVVATPAHRAAFGAAFGAALGAGAGPGTAGAGGLLMADSAETLDSFLAGGRIDPARFRDTVGGLMAGHDDAAAVDEVRRLHSGVIGPGTVMIRFGLELPGHKLHRIRMQLPRLRGNRPCRPWNFISKASISLVSRYLTDRLSRPRRLPMG